MLDTTPNTGRHHFSEVGVFVQVDIQSRRHRLPELCELFLRRSIANNRFSADRLEGAGLEVVALIKVLCHIITYSGCTSRRPGTLSKNLIGFRMPPMAMRLSSARLSGSALPRR